MSDDYGYGDLPKLIKQAAKEATIAAMMQTPPWDYRDEQFVYAYSKSNAYGSTDHFEIRLNWDGSTDGDLASKTQIAEVKQFFDQVKTYWDEKIPSLLADWTDDQLPDPADFEDPIARAQLAVGALATGRGNGSSDIANPALEKIDLIDDGLHKTDDDQSLTVTRFREFYGPVRLETVFDGHCEAATVLGLALTGEQQLWTKAREDIAEVTRTARDAFKACQGGNDARQHEILGVVTATAGLLATFATGPAGLAFKAVSAGGSYVQSVTSSFATESAQRELIIEGDTPNAVLDGFEGAIEALSSEIKKQEELIQDSLIAMTNLVNENRDNFHIHAKRDLAPKFVNSGTIEMDFPVLKVIGYEYMPTVATGYLRAEDYLQQSRALIPWVRPMSIGMGPYGPFNDWDSLLTTVAPLLNDTAAEVVRAGEVLAVAAGYLEDTDHSARDILKGYGDELNGTSLGWQKQDQRYFSDTEQPLRPDPRIAP